MDYLIWSNEHNSWWAPNRLGYIQNIMLAGLYTRQEAMEIVKDATLGEWPSKPPSELPIRVSDLPLVAREMIQKDK